MKTNSAWRPLFVNYISHLKIDSKEQGICSLIPNGSQDYFLDEVCEGLDRGIRHFTCLKARQLGISTIGLAVDAFWLMVHEGIQGALVVDTEGNRDKFRVLLERYITSLPRGLRVGVKRSNRNILELNNGSTLDFVVAGTKKKRGALGVSRAFNFVHATEISSWGSDDGVDSLIAALAQNYPDRFYLFESTARGFNLFWDMWTNAKKDHLTQKAFFIGWWSKEDYTFAQGTEAFNYYWNGKFDDAELEKMAEVKKLYGVEIIPEQIAWHRWMRTMKITNPDMMASEYPWTENEAFVMSGKSFFSTKTLAHDIKEIAATDVPFEAFRYQFGSNFVETKMDQVFNAADADLRVWEEPKPGGVYVMGVDPAWGRSDNKDNHAIEIYRGYADRLVQCAEVAMHDCETYQIAWVMAHLAGFYKNVWINLEVNGPGNALMQELKHLKQLFDTGTMKLPEGDGSSEEFFSLVRWYLYHRPDSLSAGYVYGFSTTGNTKMVIMNQLRDNYALRLIEVRSIPLLREMEKVVQDGAQIEAQGRNKDDRTFASALANKAYIEWVRGPMITTGQTFETTQRLEAMQKDQPRATMIGRVVNDFFAQQQLGRQEQEHAEAWGDLYDDN